MPQVVDPQKIFLPPIHIKLRLMKDFVNVINRNGEYFQYILYKFPWIRNAKVKDVIFFCPQIMAVMNDKNFDEVLQGNVNPAWEALKLVVDNFLGRQEPPRGPERDT